ncbi:MAG: hypothetical protein AAGH15_00810, partial [Myxococcota bacterium]
MPSLRLLPLLLVALGCGPTLRTRTLELEAFRSPEVCGQGPYDLVLKAAGAPWGETLEVRVLSPHPLRGYSEILVDGAPRGDRAAFGSFLVGRGSQGTNGRSWRYVHAEQQAPDNARCLHGAGPEGPVVAAPSSGEASPGAAAAPGPAPVPGAPGNAGLEPAPYPSTWSLDLGAEWMERNALGYQTLQRAVWGQSMRSLPLTPPIRGGAEIRIRIWSDEPNLLEGVIFVVLHEALEPSVSDEAWLAHLERRAEEARREDEARWAANERENEARRRHCAANPDDDACRPAARRTTP